MRRLLHLLGIHTWEERRYKWASISVAADEVFERCKFCHTPKLGSWRLEDINGTHASK